MRHGRFKATRRTLKFYSLNGGIKSPYNLVLDGNFLAAVVRQKIEIRERLSRLLQSEPFTLYVTRSSLDELNSLPGDVFVKARQFGLDECEILEKDSIPPMEDSDERLQSGDDSTNDILRLVLSSSNKTHYFVATLDEELVSSLRNIPFVPLLRLSRAVLTLELPSLASKNCAARNETGKLLNNAMTEEERGMVQSVRDSEKRFRQEKAKERRVEEEREHGRGGGRIKTKAKNPNPLSCKKRKKDGEGGQKKKRTRSKKKSSSGNEN